MPVIALRALLGLAVPVYAAYLATGHGRRFSERRPRLSAAIGGGLAVSAGGWGLRSLLRRGAAAATVGGVTWAANRVRDRRAV
jgi:hypothetical protein